LYEDVSQALPGKMVSIPRTRNLIQYNNIFININMKEALTCIRLQIFRHTVDLQTQR
jgi:hypothetical protein